MDHFILQEKNLPNHFWDEVFYCAKYILNHIPARAFSFVTPVDKWFGNNPSIGHL
jgi:hypothetical protein